MNKRVLILHGLGGSDFPHWQAQLARDLIKQNTTVSFPALPSRENPSLEEWKEFVKKEIEHFKPTVIVCHSLANILWFHICEELDINLDKLMLVAPVQINCDIEEIKEFFPYPIPSDLKSKEVIMAASTNDPYMNVEEAIRLQSKLKVGMKLLEEAGHINADSGYGRLDCALDWINREIECRENSGEVE